MSGTDAKTQELTVLEETDALTDKTKVKLTADELRRAYDLRYKNKLSYGEIGKQLDRNKSTIYDALKRFELVLGDKAEVETFKEHEAHLIDGARWKILCNLSDDDRLKKASVNNLAYAFQSMYNAQRLERGESTSNIAYQ